MDGIMDKEKDEFDAGTSEKTTGNSNSKNLYYIKIAQGLFMILAVIWLLFSVISLIRFPGLSTWILACLMIGNAGMLLLVGWGLGSRHRRIYYMALIVLLVNIVLTLTDDFGIYDFIILVLYLVLSGILLATRSLYRNVA
jgi:lysylphosphatidylglycerol synthetase-like protein (DUF2156 family)